MDLDDGFELPCNGQVSLEQVVGLSCLLCSSSGRVGFSLQSSDLRSQQTESSVFHVGPVRQGAGIYQPEFAVFWACPKAHKDTVFWDSHHPRKHLCLRLECFQVCQVKWDKWRINPMQFQSNGAYVSFMFLKTCHWMLCSWVVIAQNCQGRPERLMLPPVSGLWVGSSWQWGSFKVIAVLISTWGTAEGRNAVPLLLSCIIQQQWLECASGSICVLIRAICSCICGRALGPC